MKNTLEISLLNFAISPQEETQAQPKQTEQLEGSQPESIDEAETPKTINISISMTNLLKSLSNLAALSFFGSIIARTSLSAYTWFAFIRSFGGTLEETLKATLEAILHAHPAINILHTGWLAATHPFLFNLMGQLESIIALSGIAAFAFSALWLIAAIDALGENLRSKFNNK